MADVVVNGDNTNPNELLGQGIRAYVLQDYNSAVNALSKASEILVAEHGDDCHDSLADVYLYYGKALLGLSREDSEALGDAVKNKDESDDDEEDVENTETGVGGEKEETDHAKTNGTVEANEGTAETDGKSEDAKDDVVTNGTVEEGEPSGSAPADNEDEPTDLQVAWEVLELAKKIYGKRGDEGKRNLAEALVVLGEVSMESENFESAVNDIKEGLRLQKELFPDDSRTVAETYYKLGMAHSTNSQIDEAVECFEASLRYLQNRMANLEKKEGAEEEIGEIKELVPDIEEKIADMKSYKDETMTQIMSAISESKPATAGGASSTTSTSANSSKPASDISHLVKRKRKVDEILEESEKKAEAGPAKKTEPVRNVLLSALVHTILSSRAASP